MALAKITVLIIDDQKHYPATTETREIIDAPTLVSLLDKQRLAQSFSEWWAKLESPVTIVLVPTTKEIIRVSNVGANAKNFIQRVLWIAGLPNNLLFSATEFVLKIKGQEAKVEWRNFI